MIDPKRTTRAREEHSRDGLYQQAERLYEAADICYALDDEDNGHSLHVKADLVYEIAEKLEDAIASGHFGR